MRSGTKAKWSVLTGNNLQGKYTFRNRQVAGSSPALGSRIPRQKRALGFGLPPRYTAFFCCFCALAVFVQKGRFKAGFLDKFILRGNLEECLEYGNAVATLSTARRWRRSPSRLQAPRVFLANFRQL